MGIQLDKVREQQRDMRTHNPRGSTGGDKGTTGVGADDVVGAIVGGRV